MINSKITQISDFKKKGQINTENFDVLELFQIMN
jgi:hypothetical protein